MYVSHPSMFSGGSILRAQGVARSVLLPSAGWCCYQNEFFTSEEIQLTVMFPRATSLCTKEKSLKCGSKIGSERESRRCGSAAIASRTAFITSDISTLLDVVLKESSLVNIFQRHLASV